MLDGHGCLFHCLHHQVPVIDEDRARRRTHHLPSSEAFHRFEHQQYKGQGAGRIPLGNGRDHCVWPTVCEGSKLKPSGLDLPNSLEVPAPSSRHSTMPHQAHCQLGLNSVEPFAHVQTDHNGLWVIPGPGQTQHGRVDPLSLMAPWMSSVASSSIHRWTSGRLTMAVETVLARMLITLMGLKSLGSASFSLGMCQQSQPFIPLRPISPQVQESLPKTSRPAPNLIACPSIQSWRTTALAPGCMLKVLG